MTNNEYRAFLSKLESTLPALERELKDIKPESNARISYSVGQIMDQNRVVGLLEISNTRDYISRQRGKRTVSGELALFSFLQSLYDSLESQTTIEDLTGVTFTHLERYVPILSPLILQIGSDSLARVVLLEKGICPTA